MQIDGEQIADDIASAIENAQDDIQAAHETADEIARAAMETALGRRIEEIERRFEEWQSNQTDQSEATAALVLGLTEMKAQLDMLTQLQSLTRNPPSGEDGPRENQEEIPEEIPAAIVEPEAPAQEPETPASAPKKKRHRWI